MIYWNLHHLESSRCDVLFESATTAYDRVRPLILTLVLIFAVSIAKPSCQLLTAVALLLDVEHGFHFLLPRLVALQYR